MTTPQSPFAQPSSASAGDNFNPAELNGHLLLVYPGAVKQVMTQNYGEKEAITADVIVLDVIDQSTGHPPVLKDTLIFNAVLIGQLKGEGSRGGMVLGRLGQGANTKGNAPWLLLDYTPQDEQVGRAYIASHPREQFARPQTQQQAPPAPAPTQWGQAPAGQPPQQQWGQQNGTPQAQPQYASQALPYDPWQGTQAAPGGQPQGAPAGPPQGQWGTAPAAPPAAPGGAPAQQWGTPQPNGQGAPSGAPAPAPGGPAQAAAGNPPLDPQLAAFLQSHGVNPEGMSDGQARMIAATFQQ